MRKCFCGCYLQLCSATLSFTHVMPLYSQRRVESCLLPFRYVSFACSRHGRLYKLGKLAALNTVVWLVSERSIRLPGAVPLRVIVSGLSGLYPMNRTKPWSTCINSLFLGNIQTWLLYSPVQCSHCSGRTKRSPRWMGSATAVGRCEVQNLKILLLTNVRD